MLRTLTDRPVANTDVEEGIQWLSALDQAERYGEQMAWLKHDTTYEWKHEMAIHTAYTGFMNQFTTTKQQDLRLAFHSGFVGTWMKLALDRINA